MKRGFLKANNKVAPPAQAEVKPLKPVPIPVSPRVPPAVTQVINFDIPFSMQVVFQIRELNLFTHLLLYAGTKEAMLKELQPVQVESPWSLSNPFVLRKVPGQGTGAFTKNAYNPGDLILDERPIFVTPQFFNPQSEPSREHVLKLAVDEMSPPSKELFGMLYNCKTNDPKDVVGIIGTNALGIGRLPGPYEYDYAALFILISRINHSCIPNAEYYWDLKTFKSYIVASRPIAADEQVFIAYTPIFESRAERQKVLREKYAFTCTCASCSLPKDLSARSDVKRKILASAYAKLNQQQKEHERALKQWIEDLSLPDDHILKPARFLMQLMEEEQAFDSSLWLVQAEIACKALCALSDRAGVVELAQKASAYAKLVLSADHVGWKKVAAAPEKTEWWGLRKKATN
ncbi:hypothetical protein C0993_009529 [Termitomyces sp. T159_Od127]|nr:hypothetical protein C0993_009529 [Termitomyces sp. T159_Od127]